ncbi:MAG: hypothetical protein MH825_08140 [Cyanobacteria bacterium]|nr:hypothetical protein [Cyanobacteriota bacterium]
MKPTSWLSEAKNCDFARLTVFPFDQKGTIFIKEGKAVTTDEGVRLLLNVQHIYLDYGSGEVNGKKLKVEDHPFIFIDLHDKPWTRKGYQGNPDTTAEPVPLELYLCEVFKANAELANGFKGEINLADYSALMELVQSGSIPIDTVHSKMAQLEPVQLSTEFGAKKEPPIYGKGGQKGGYTAKSEGDKAKERLAFLIEFCDPDNANGAWSDKSLMAMDVLFGPQRPTDAVERFVKLILP